MNKKQLFESDRITLTEHPEKLEVIISGKIPGKQFNLLSVWLFSWTAAGIFVLTQVFSPMPDNQRIFMVVWLGFWLYFEYKIGTAWVWRKYGHEQVILTKDKLLLRFEVPVGRRASEFETANIETVMNLEEQKGLFVKNYYSSFWVKGGETIGFNYNGRLYSFGRQLSVADSKTLIAKINHKLNRR